MLDVFNPLVPNPDAGERTYAYRLALDEPLSEPISYTAYCWVLMLVHTGEMTYYVGDMKYVATERHVFISFPQQEVRIERISDNFTASVLTVPNKVMYSAMREDMTPKDFSKIPSSQRNIGPLFPQNMELSRRTCQELHKLFGVLLPRVAPQCIWEKRGLSIALIEAMVLLILEENKASKAALLPKSRNEVIVSKFMVELQKHFREHHDTAFYANKVCLSTKYLTAVVKKTTNATPQEWISRSLHYEACRLLSNTDMPVNEIADLLEFSSAASFVRFFRSREGVTPGFFRSYQHKEEGQQSDAELS